GDVDELRGARNHPVQEGRRVVAECSALACIDQRAPREAAPRCWTRVGQEDAAVQALPPTRRDLAGQPLSVCAERAQLARGDDASALGCLALDQLPRQSHSRNPAKLDDQDGRLVVALWTTPRHLSSDRGPETWCPQHDGGERPRRLRVTKRLQPSELPGRGGRGDGPPTWRK